MKRNWTGVNSRDMMIGKVSCLFYWVGFDPLHPSDHHLDLHNCLLLLPFSLQLVQFTQQTSPVNTYLFRDRGWRSRTGKASPCFTSPPNWVTSSLCGGSSTRHNAGFSICRMSMEEPRWALRGMRSLPGEALIVNILVDNDDVFCGSQSFIRFALANVFLNKKFEL